MSQDQNCSICGSRPIQANMDYFSLASHSKTQSFIICEKCIKLLHSALSSVKDKPAQDSADSAKERRSTAASNTTPQDIYNHLGEYIIGQEEAKRTVAVAVFQHFQRIRNPELKRKSNILIVGPTGSGKTEIARSIAQFLNVPFAQVDTTTMTPRGYVGDSPEICVEKLFMAANGNVEEAERGIIFLDEFDKVPSGVEVGSFRAKAVQQELLTMMSGTSVDIKVGGEQGQKVTIDTSKILFIAAGSFAGIERFMNIEQERVLGIAANFDKKPTAVPTRPEFKHFVEFGLIPEILGRLPVVCYTNELTKADLVRVLTDPKGSVIEHYQKLFELSGAELLISHDCLEDLAENAMLEKLGARGLAKQLESKLQPLIFNIHQYHGMKVTVGSKGFEVESINHPVEITSEIIT